MVGGGSQLHAIPGAGEEVKFICWLFGHDPQIKEWEPCEVLPGFFLSRYMGIFCLRCGEEIAVVNSDYMPYQVPEKKP